jgi:hypothetical protein
MRDRPSSVEAHAVVRRGVETLTIVWMLCVVTAFLCEVAALAAVGAARFRFGGTRLVALGERMLFAALVIGLIALAMTPVVVRMRAEPPPTAVVVFAVAVGALPWMIILARQAF